MTFILPSFGASAIAAVPGGGGGGEFNISTQDTESNIFASTPTNPSGEVTIAYATDTQSLCIYDGISWVTYDNNFTV
tara:strand:+ start:574 stop:804 length:231 start_codon:yes stop_codon:yes gene_type:complete